MSAAGASATGNHAESMVLSTINTYLTKNAYSYKDWVAAGEPNDCVVKNFPYTSIYGSDTSKTEFVLVYPGGKRVRIEVKWQASQGSVDEKFPYVVENAIRWPEDFVIIIAAGGGAKPKAIDWLAENAPMRGHEVGKQIVVFRTVDEFMRWAAREQAAWF